MRKYIGVARDTAGNVVASATITVYLTGLSTLATLYSDEGSTLKGNPFTTDSNGRFNFYASDGEYDIKISGSNITTYTITDIPVVDVYAISNSYYSHINDSNAHSTLTQVNHTYIGDQPFLGLNDSGLDGKHWRWISEYGCLKLQHNVGTTPTPEWYDIFIINSFIPAGDKEGKMKCELIIRGEVKGQFRTDIADLKEPDTY